MYLKSIEIQGFKSFANKIVFEFHNGITGIVGPNGSGKSNVADAVRWVLGEQKVKQLRSSSMQDVIFSGTETRKPQGFASVAITLDNSDHQLAIDYDQVTVTRRVYRSGESEYMINGSTCRLKDINELFYDTGIGKEGYSIIGQGQIDKILSGKPEERRELFDEAAGIVKFKRRKAIAQKKLEDEKQNLVRVTDILSELEKQVGPLAKQSEAAKEYLRLKEDLKKYDVNQFLLETAGTRGQLKETEENAAIVSKDLEETRQASEHIRVEYETLDAILSGLEAAAGEARTALSEANMEKGTLEGRVGVLNEQINTEKMNAEHIGKRMTAIHGEIADKKTKVSAYEEERSGIAAQVKESLERLAAAEEALKKKDEEIRALEEAYAKAEVPVVSNNSAHRWTPDVPMVVPEINPEHFQIIEAQKKRLGTTRGFIAVKPNCSIQSYAPVLTAWKEFEPYEVVATTYQAISGAGKTFKDWPEMEGNIIPFIGGEEEKSEQEPLRIWGKIENGVIVKATEPKITCQCIRVPVLNGHTAAVFVKFRKKPTKEQLIEKLENFKGLPQELNLPSAPKQFIRYMTEDNRPQVTLDVNYENGMGINVGRLREDTIYDWKFVGLSHNTVRGAAGGAVLCAETLVAKKFIAAK